MLLFVFLGFFVLWDKAKTPYRLTIEKKTNCFNSIFNEEILNIIFGLFFGGIQAFVFAILAVAYINVAVEE